ncbi:hypothetical protein PJN38_24235 [Mycobacterium kansasii]
MSYRVIAPLVLAKDSEGKTHHRYEGEIIQWLSPAQASHFLGLGLVEARNEALTPVGDPVGDGDKPKQVAPKAAWIEYAVSRAPQDQRLTADEAEAMTKAELVERFG